MSNILTSSERKELNISYNQLIKQVVTFLSTSDIRKIKSIIYKAIKDGNYGRDKHGNSILLRNINTALILSKEFTLEYTTLVSILLYTIVANGTITEQEVAKIFGDDVAKIIHHLIKTETLYQKNTTIESDNFRKLLLSFAQDARVIIILIADSLCLMRMINDHPDNDYRLEIASEASYLYAPLAHRLGLYKIKSELEDLSLKYLNRDIYISIANKLSETKEKRERYIQSFITPIKKKLTDDGYQFDIKGRTKSIYSIYNKMKKQRAEFEDIYDLFAIRIVLDIPLEREKEACWRIFSYLTDLYTPNPKRMRDWITIPKSNGYESLHVTLWGPEDRWIEVQIRTKRMDEIAENGLAAHWKYKGVKSESGLDDWLNSMRDILETSDERAALDIVKDFSKDDYDKEVFVFSPKGDLYKLTKGATVLDFAYLIHTNLGNRCTGARVDEKNQTIRYQLKSGDTVEILTSANQKPKLDWLNIVSLPRTKTKIRQSLKEVEYRDAEYGREMLMRRMKNRKIEAEEQTLTKLIKTQGFKTGSKFFAAIAQEKLDVNSVIERYIEIKSRSEEEIQTPQRAADTFVHQVETQTTKDDVLVIDGSLKDIDYKISKCCNAIYGDEIFGFVNSQGGIKIHRVDCPNANDLRGRYGYRVVKAKWSGKQGSQYVVILQVIGNDDISIVSNITSVISKEKGVSMRNISIESRDGLFQGHLTVMVSEKSVLNGLIKKLKGVKGIKSVQRANE